MDGIAAKRAEAKVRGSSPRAAASSPDAVRRAAYRTATGEMRFLPL